MFVTLRVAACTQRPFAKLSSVKTGTEAVLSRPLTDIYFPSYDYYCFWPFRGLISFLWPPGLIRQRFEPLKPRSINDKEITDFLFIKTSLWTRFSSKYQFFYILCLTKEICKGLHTV